MRLDVSRNVRFTLKNQKIFYLENRAHSKNISVQNDIFLNPYPSTITLSFTPTLPPFSFTKTLKKLNNLGILQTATVSLFDSLFESSLTQLRSNYKIFKDQSAHTTTRAYIYIYIYIYTYIYFKAINNVLDAKTILRTHMLIKIFCLLYRNFVVIYVSMYMFIFMTA